jgi:hypothetical protein
LVAVFTDFVADEGASRRAANGAHGAAKHGIASNPADYSADAGADLGARGIRSATTHCQGRSAGGRKKDVTDVHGEIP